MAVFWAALQTALASRTSVRCVRRSASGIAFQRLDVVWQVVIILRRHIASVRTTRHVATTTRYPSRPVASARGPARRSRAAWLSPRSPATSASPLPGRSAAKGARHALRRFLVHRRAKRRHRLLPPPVVLCRPQGGPHRTHTPQEQLRRLILVCPSCDEACRLRTRAAHSGTSF